MMSRPVRRTALAAAVLVMGWLTVGTRGQSAPAPSTRNGEWPAYTADLHGTKYSPLDQIDAGNFNKLEIAWRFKTDNLGSRPEYKLEGTPLMVGGVLYTTGGTRRAVVAIDARTGEQLWTHRYPEGVRGANAPRQLSGRGVAYWTDGRGDNRILYVTPGYRLIALDAKTGQPVSSFGKDGVVDLKVGAVSGSGQPIDLDTGEIGLHSTPTVARDVVIVGSSFKEGMTITTHNNTKGLVRAFDARSGKLLWTFNTIPRPGEFGNDTWLNGSWAVTGNAGVWTQITVDEALGLVYLPVESPSSDYYGGLRPGNNLFGESLVCVDLKTGQRKWHFQLVHHPIWDNDISSAPLLLDVMIDGRMRKLVAQPTKQSYLYVFDRVTGEPIWPIPETRVPPGDVPGEWYSPTQPIPSKPPAYGRPGLRIPDELIDFTPEMRAQALDNVKHYKWGGDFPFNGTFYNPPIVGNANGLLGALNIGNASGGTNWPGAAADPETGIVYAQASTSSLAAESVAPPPAGFSDIPYQAGVVGQPFRLREAAGAGTYADVPNRRPQPAVAPQLVTPPGEGGAAPVRNYLAVEGLSLVKPPYGVMAAIDLARGELKWQVPHGDTPDVVRNHAKLKGMTIARTGQTGSVGVLVTRTLVIAGDPQVTTTPDHPRGAMMRAYDKQTGREVGAIWMPAPVSGSPMTYRVNGRQYIVIAVSGGNYSGEYLSFALPENELATTTAQAGR
jgi:quinoprotein glucose dehydrogenase